MNQRGKALDFVSWNNKMSLAPQKNNHQNGNHGNSFQQVHLSPTSVAGKIPNLKPTRYNDKVMTVPGRNSSFIAQNSPQSNGFPKVILRSNNNRTNVNGASPSQNSNNFQNVRLKPTNVNDKPPMPQQPQQQQVESDTDSDVVGDSPLFNRKFHSKLPPPRNETLEERAARILGTRPVSRASRSGSAENSIEEAVLSGRFTRSYSSSSSSSEEEVPPKLISKSATDINKKKVVGPKSVKARSQACLNQNGQSKMLLLKKQQNQPSPGGCNTATPILL